MTGFKDRSRKLAREDYWEKHDRETYECPDCGRPESEIRGRFEVHHKNGEPLDNRPENRVALCQVCHNLREGKKPSVEHIRSLRDSVSEEGQAPDYRESISVSEIESIYLAGTMTYQGEDSYWSASVTKDASTTATWRHALGEMGPIEVNSPEDLHFNHGGDLVAGVTGCDIELLQKSDAILAYFNKKEQVGTLTELLYALEENKPALVLFNSRFIDPPAVDPFEEIDSSYQWVRDSVGMRAESPVYWFLVNFLIGDSSGFIDGSYWDGVESNVQVGVVSNKSGLEEAYRDWAEPILNSVDAQALSGESYVAASGREE